MLQEVCRGTSHHAPRQQTHGHKSHFISVPPLLLLYIIVITRDWWNHVEGEFFGSSQVTLSDRVEFYLIKTLESQTDLNRQHLHLYFY